MQFRTTLLVIGVAAVMGSGCASDGGVPRDAFSDPARIGTIVPGTTTRQQVRESLGNPQNQLTLNGDTTWTYRSYRDLPLAYVPFSNAQTPSMQLVVVSIVFSPDGVVKKVDTDKQQW